MQTHLEEALSKGNSADKTFANHKANDSASHLPNLKTMKIRDKSAT